jgi:hypothetical protein
VECTIKFMPPKATPTLRILISPLSINNMTKSQVCKVAEILVTVQVPEVVDVKILSRIRDLRD